MNVSALVKHALDLDNESVTNIKRAGGMTNRNYFITINSEEYVVRLPGYGTSELINRKTERANLEFATKLGINPKLIYFNEKTGMKITKKVPNVINLTPVLAKKNSLMKEIANLFKIVHGANETMQNDFKLFSLMNHYWELVRTVNELAADKLEGFRKEIFKLKKRYELLENIPSKPCHIDPAASNFLIDQTNNVYLIDWEYSGMFDPLWDIAAFVLECDFSKQEEEVFFSLYFGRKANKIEAKRILLYKIFQDYLWSLWAMYKEAKGDDLGSYAMFRLKRAKNHIRLFQSVYNQIEAG